MKAMVIDSSSQFAAWVLGLAMLMAGAARCCVAAGEDAPREINERGGLPNVGAQPAAGSEIILPAPFDLARSQFSTAACSVSCSNTDEASPTNRSTTKSPAASTMNAPIVPRWQNGSVPRAP